MKASACLFRGGSRPFTVGVVGMDRLTRGSKGSTHIIKPRPVNFSSVFGLVQCRAAPSSARMSPALPIASNSIREGLAWVQSLNRSSAMDISYVRMCRFDRTRGGRGRDVATSVSIITAEISAESTAISTYWSPCCLLRGQGFTSYATFGRKYSLSNIIK